MNNDVFLVVLVGGERSRGKQVTLLKCWTVKSRRRMIV
jgi:hypothetical protein